jgi:type III secretion protein D
MTQDLNLPQPPGPAAPPVAARWELHVLRGVHAGARAALEPGAWSLLGSARDCDWVLRDEGVLGHHLVFTSAAGKLSIRALDGAFSCEGSTVEPGASMVLSGVQVCRVGDVAIGIGPADSPAWAELNAVANEPPRQAPVEPIERAAGDANAAEAASAAPDEAAPPAGWLRWRPALGRRISGPQAGWGLVSVLLLAAGAALWTVRAHRVEAREAMASISGTIDALGLTEVRPVQGPDGHLRLEGVVANESLRNDLAHALNSRGLYPAIAVANGESLAATVQNVFRQRGQQVNARYVGDGRVDVAGAATSAQTDWAIRDVLASTRAIHHVGLVDPSDADTATAAAAPPMPGNAAASKPAAPTSASAPRDPKRVVGVVGGDTAFVLTQDGARYLAGAMLPDGSQVETVEGHLVTFLREGQRVQIEF